MRTLLFSLLLSSSFALAANSKSESKVVTEKSMAPFEAVGFGERLEIRIGEVEGVEYIRQPGGAITGIKTPDEFALQITLESSNLRRKTQLKRTASDPHPTVDWNHHRVTLMSVDAAERGYKVKLRREGIPLRKLASGEVFKSLVSGDEVSGPGDLIIRHVGYVNAHRMSADGRSSSETSCQIEVFEGAERKTFHISAPIQKPVTEVWKNWTFVFTKTDPNGGMLAEQTPVEFQVTQK